MACGGAYARIQNEWATLLALLKTSTTTLPTWAGTVLAALSGVNAPEACEAQDFERRKPWYATTRLA